MKFKNIEVDEESGKMSFDVAVNKEEIEYLVDFAVNRLLAEGAISLSGLAAEEEVELHRPLN